MKKSFVVLTATLALTSSPAHAVGGQAGQIWDFYQQIQQWIGSLTNLDKLKQDIFGDVNWNDLQSTLVDKALNLGIDASGLNVQDMLKNIGNFQGVVDGIRGEIKNQAKGFFKLAWLDTATEPDQKGSIGLATQLATNKFEAAREMAQASKETEARVQDLADSTKVLEENKLTVEETAERAEQTAQNAAVLTEAAQNATSTREAAQLMVRALAENMTSQAYNATAITTSLSQVARQSNVLNKQLDVLVQDTIRRRVGAAKEVLRKVEEQRLNAEVQGQAVGQTVNNTAKAISTPFASDMGSVNYDDLYK